MQLQLRMDQLAEAARRTGSGHTPDRTQDPTQFFNADQRTQSLKAVDER